MTALALRRVAGALSRTYTALVASHRRALAAPMIGAQMKGDPFIGVRDKPAAALLERRACQYAAAMARKSGLLPADQAAFHAVYQPDAGTVHFITGAAEGKPKVYAKFEIPRRVLEFDPDASLLALPAPEAVRDPDTVEMRI